jgi:predicted nuclease with RNAse H fold
MLFSNTAYIGIDPTAGRSPFTYAALDEECNLLALSEGELEDVLTFAGNFPAATAAVNAPSRVNAGLVRKRLEKETLTPHSLRGADLRMAEYDLRERGISVFTTPSRVETCSGWVQLGFSLYKRLAKMGFRAYPQEGAEHVWLETHPHACYCALLGQVPLPKPTLEGRLQRQILLHDSGVRIKDPMGFFEEITRRRLRMGVMPMELIYHPEQLDALIAAYTAWMTAKHPAETMCVGGKEEGFIVLPVGELREKY